MALPSDKKPQLQVIRYTREYNGVRMYINKYI